MTLSHVRLSNLAQALALPMLVVLLSGCFGGGSSSRKAALTTSGQPAPAQTGTASAPDGPGQTERPPTSGSSVPEQQAGEPEWASSDATATAGVSPPAPATVGRAGTIAPAVGRPESQQPDHHFKTLDEAVQAGQLDASVAAEVQKSGSADALVTFEHQADLNRAKANAPLGRGRAEAVLDAVKPVFAAKKTRIIGAASSKLDVLENYENLALLLIRFHSTEDLLAVANAPDVTGVHANRKVRLSLTESLPLIRQPEVAAAGFKGAGTTVAVIDTGVAYKDYPSYFNTCTAPGTPSTCRFATAYEAATSDGADDSVGHGTHVASIVASVAPATKIIAADVFGLDTVDGEPVTEDGAIAKGVNWAVGQAKTYNVRALNLSLGSLVDPAQCSKTSPDGTDTLDFQTVRAAGILPVVAAGNSAWVSSLFGGDFQFGIAWPACVPGAVSVGAVYDSSMSLSDSANWDCGDFQVTQDDIACFSQTGDNLSILAPGSEIDAAGGVKQGTSMAAPHVAGAAAVLAAAVPSASVDQIQSALVNSGPQITDQRFDHPITRRRLDLAAARSSLAATVTTDKTPPTVTAPSEQIGGAQMTSATVPVVESWSATDPSGIKAYSLWYSTNGGVSWTQVSLATLTTTRVTLPLTIGTTYIFTVAAQDGAGNWSSYVSGPSFKVDAQDDKSAAITWATGWTRYVWSDAYAGYAVTSSTTGASATFSFTGRDVSWIAPYFSGAGQAKVYIDGTYVATVDLNFSTTWSRWPAYSYHWSSAGSHKIKVAVVGTSGRPRVDVDAFAVLR